MPSSNGAQIGYGKQRPQRPVRPFLEFQWVRRPLAGTLAADRELASRVASLSKTLVSLVLGHRGRWGR